MWVSRSVNPASPLQLRITSPIRTIVSLDLKAAHPPFGKQKNPAIADEEVMIVWAAVDQPFNSTLDNFVAKEELEWLDESDRQLRHTHAARIKPLMAMLAKKSSWLINLESSCSLARPPIRSYVSFGSTIGFAKYVLQRNPQDDN